MNRSRIALAILAAAALAAPLALAEDIDTEARVKNKDPTMTAITLSDDEPGTAGYQVQPVAGGTKTVTVSFSTNDGNGNADIEKVDFSVLRPDQSALHTTLTATGGSSQGTTREWTATFDVEFHEPPGTYTVSARVEDVKGGEGVLTQTFAYQELLAFDPNPKTVEFSATDLEPATNSPVAGVGVRNMGNVALDAQVSGTDMDAATFDASIGVERVKYGLAPDLGDAVSLGTSPTTLTTFDLAPGAASVRDIFFRVDVPSGEEQFIPADTYQGSITIGAGVSS